MSKFKVGDKVALSDTTYDYFGRVIDFAIGSQLYYIVAMSDDEYRIMKESELVMFQELSDMTNEEIYNMLKPKLDKADVLKYGYYYHDHTMFNVDETIKAIALAYRSGYLRAKKGRSFKIGGEKE